MASTYSTNLAIELIGTGDQAGTWGNTTNTNLGTLIEQAISGYVTQAVSTGTDTTITIPNGATGVARNMYIELTGTGGTNTNLIVPSNKKLYFIFNNASGAVTVKVSGQTGVSVPAGKKVVLASNGTDTVNALNYIADFGSNSATITQLTATSATITNLTLTSLVISNLSIASANVTVLTSASATITNLLATSLTVSSGSTLNGGVVINEPGADVDFRVEGDTDANLFFADASTDRIGIGTNNPGAKVNLEAADNVSEVRLSRASTNIWGSIQQRSTSGALGLAFNANDGNASTPGFVWRTATDGSTFTERMVLNTTGLGIGTTSPSGRLHVAGTVAVFEDNNFYFQLQRGATPFAYIGTGSNTAGGAVTDLGIRAENNMVFSSGGGTERARITSGGSLLVGTTSGTATITANASGGATIRALRESVSATNHIQMEHDGTNGKIAVSGANALLFDTNGTERARITSDGDLLVGRTSTINSSKIVCQGNSYGWVGTNSGVDGTYIDWFALAPYAANTSEQHRIRASVSSTAGNSGIQFMISDGGGASTQTESFRINRTSCTVVGALSKGSGSFKIDHPLKPDTHHLVHSFIEGPQADLIYRGKAALVNGKAIINIDEAAGMTEGTFVALCREVQCFTSNESDWDAVRGSVSGNKLTIECQNQSSSAVISWLVIGERQDKHMYDTDWTDENGKVIVEPEKVKPVEAK